MNFSYFKFMFFINKTRIIHYLDLVSKFNISELDARNIVGFLNVKGYIQQVSDTKYIPTYKGKHFIIDFFMDWLSTNFIAILALIVSIIALIFSGLALLNT